ncbi:Ger(x)C family spore germination protein [Paenibacillus sp. NPDC056579]|uniref:Ger(x)C family spore germination protein n=1 Tax=unclassified Paenibacillus TaxID=185978 RepID=UPI001EF8C915|nr:Ger(x)C family spore germination protein [Paenibacillus sp. H1-7]ULL14089.1 Ger(x)C family spore germination protein [Paenibacillus sp. H1-7]
MRKPAILLVLTLVSLCLTACWNRTELNKLSITSATAMDYENGEWMITFQVVIPSAISSGVGTVGGGTSQSPIAVHTSRGKTIREAVSNSNFESPRWLFFAHNSVIIISEQVARSGGLNQIVDLYFRNPDARETVNVLVTTENARDVLQQMMHLEKIPGQGLREIMAIEARYSSTLPSIMLYELAMGMTSASKGAVIPEIIISGTKKVDSMNDLSHTSVTSVLKLGRLGVIKDGKLTGWLTRNESLGVSLITNKVKSSVLPFACKPSDGQNYNSSYRLDTSKTKIVPKKVNGRFVMEINIKGNGMLLETDCPLELNKPDVVKQLEKQLQNQIKTMVETSWKATRRLHVDILGFADIIHRKFPKDWKTMRNQWDSAFQDIEIETKVHITMSRIGLSTKSFKAITKDEEG